jgi:hypothetical protein
MKKLLDYKRPHTLHNADGPDDFLVRFRAECGQDLLAVAKGVLPTAPIVSCIVGGSIPLGIATGVSDIDVIILIDGDHVDIDRGVTTASMFQASVTGDPAELALANAVVMLGHVEVDFMVVSLQRVAVLGERVARSGILLTRAETRLLSRIKSGWVVIGGNDMRRRCASLFDDNSFELHCMVSNLVFSFKAYEDATAALSDSTALATYLGCVAVERAFDSYFAGAGYTSLGDKWIRLLNRQLKSRPCTDTVVHTLTKGLTLMFPEHDGSVSKAQQYLREVAAFVSDVKRALESDLVHKVAFAATKQLDERILGAEV